MHDKRLSLLSNFSTGHSILEFFPFHFHRRDSFLYVVLSRSLSTMNTFKYSETTVLKMSLRDICSEACNWNFVTRNNLYVFFLVVFTVPRFWWVAEFLLQAAFVVFFVRFRLKPVLFSPPSFLLIVQRFIQKYSKKETFSPFKTPFFASL